MARLLFRLKDVPDDEANDIRELLNIHEINCYETEEGRWRVGLAAIWIKDNTQYAEARALIDAYEKERYLDVHDRQREAPPTLVESMVAQPLRFLMTLLAVMIILLLSIYPFWSGMHT